MQTPKPGDWVTYYPTEAQAQAINDRRAMSGYAATPHVGITLHQGNTVSPDTGYPMLITRAWGEKPDSYVNGQAFLDGNDVIWVCSAKASVKPEPGNYVWPADSIEILLKQPFQEISTVQHGSFMAMAELSNKFTAEVAEIRQDLANTRRALNTIGGGKFEPDPPKVDTPGICTLCGEPMPEGETMFKYHGYSGPCPKPPLTGQGLRAEVAMGETRLPIHHDLEPVKPIPAAEMSELTSTPIAETQPTPPAEPGKEE